MADYFRTVNAPAIEVPKLGRLERVKLSVPVLEGVPFAIVELDGARDQRQTLRLDLDKRRFLDLPERTEYAVASRQIAASIVAFLQSEPAAGRAWAVQAGKRTRPVGKIPGKGIMEKIEGTFMVTGPGETGVLIPGGHVGSLGGSAKIVTHILRKKQHRREGHFTPKNKA